MTRFSFLFPWIYARAQGLEESVGIRGVLIGITGNPGARAMVRRKILDPLNLIDSVPC